MFHSNLYLVNEFNKRFCDGPIIEMLCILSIVKDNKMNTLLIKMGEKHWICNAIICKAKLSKMCTVQNNNSRKYYYVLLFVFMKIYMTFQWQPDIIIVEHKHKHLINKYLTSHNQNADLSEYYKYMHYITSKNRLKRIETWK